MKFLSKERGDLHVLAIWEKGGVWEEEWEPLRGSPFGDLFSVVSQDTLDQALAGWTQPLALKLGLPPSGALIKLPKAAQECGQKRKCILYDSKVCFPTTKKLMSWCFEPAGIPDEKQRVAAAKAIGEWRSGVYLLLVQESHV